MVVEGSSTRRVNLSEVAAAAGVSHSTASRALSGSPRVSVDAKSAVLEAADRLGYVRDLRATDLARGRPSTVGLLVRSAERAFYGELAARIQAGTDALGMDLLIAAGDQADAQLRAVRNLLGHGVGGLIIVSGRASWEAVNLAARYVPTVTVSLGFDHPSCDVVTIDAQTEHALARRVVDLGHQSVAVTVDSSDIAHVLRSRAFRYFEVLRELGVRSSPVSIDSTESLRDSLERALDAGATAVMAGDDSTALRIMEILDTWGYQCPVDVSVTGFDSVGAYASPLLGLTSVEQPVEALAEAAVVLVRDRMEGWAGVTVKKTFPGTFTPGRTLAEPGPPRE